MSTSRRSKRIQSSNKTKDHLDNEPISSVEDHDPTLSESEGPDDDMADSASTAETAKEMAQLKTLVQQLQQQLLDRDSSTSRGFSVESAFGGTSFRPSGMAAWPAFLPVSTPVDDPNPKYKEEARSRGEHPGKFEGDKNVFDNWLRKLADKLDEDVTTFRSERSRMRYVMSQLGGHAEKSIETRYQSVERPFSGVAEMIQALETAHYDPNQASIVRKALEEHRYKPADNADIHQFISQFNSLA